MVARLFQRITAGRILPSDPTLTPDTRPSEFLIQFEAFHLSHTRIKHFPIDISSPPSNETPIESDEPKRCHACFRPRSLCFCELIPKVANQTDVLIMQHRRERSHPFNTARIVGQSLQKCRVMVAYNHELAERFATMPLSEGVGLLYPGDNAKLLSDLSPDERPKQLVVIDGTWHHAKTLFRDIPRLQTLPRYRLAPSQPGRYRIRREPNEHALSTLEATVAALSAIEPTTPGFDRLLDVFDRMIADQIGHAKSNWRLNENRRRGSANVPRVLTEDLSKIVVAYGEQERGNTDDAATADPHSPAPLFWNAVRMGAGEFFRCAIQSESLTDESFMRRLRLTPEELQPLVTVDEFRERWRTFVRPDDRVATFHRSTSKLLEDIGADFSPSIVLKSINLNPQTKESDPRTPTILSDQTSNSRPLRRLAWAVRFVEELVQRSAN
ncbi:DTW domain-containing protein [Rhodopirellula baltica SH28]|uniref:tRNA-uridine aminocarboxypropyltransferase n=1 Tax=Rhodopirellula baltica SH28 TaxID=993517 RepID=K5D857_RHOBT|nr:DTW domain-containing protein [Rhodopirellula baltica SH28]